MNAKEFYLLTRKVRQLQREYAQWQLRGINNFRILEEKKQAEKLLDAEIQRVDKIINKDAQAQQLTLNFDTK